MADDLPDERRHRLGRLAPVRQPRGVAEIEQVFVRQRRAERAGDGQPAQAAVDDENR
jgi:hypothetical protein